MTHIPYLIQDLGLILMTAAVVTIVFKKLKQPVVLGYLVAGLIVGPNFPLLPTVKDPVNISTWAEIGVIFMLFGLGLEFSFKKLALVGKSASITAVFEIFSMLGAGYISGIFLGWSKMDSLFLGGILSISSTTIIVRAFDELGMKGKNFVKLVFGVLIVEDLIAILLLVLLSSIAVTQNLSGTDLVLSSLKLAFFLVLWFLLGIYILPVLLKKFRNDLSNETILIVSIGLCLMMVIVAAHAGFSPALGAFVMGSILAETRDGHRIEHLLLPVKDLFSAIFFVSVGMLINPKVLNEHFGVILFVSVITIIGKFLSSTMGALISGLNVKSSVQTGLSLAQIGEFSFIIATLGMTLNVTSDFLYPVAVAVSAITTFSTPYLIKYSDDFYKWIESRIPRGVKLLLNRYETAMTTDPNGGILSLIWNEYGLKITLNSVIVVAITLIMSRWGLLKVNEYLGESNWSNILLSIVTLTFTAPFLWAIFFGGPSHNNFYKEDIVKQLQRLQFGIAIIRFLVGCTLVGFIVGQFTSVVAFSGVIIVILSALGIIFFSRFSGPIYHRIERRFLLNLSDKEREVLSKKDKNPELAPWNAMLTEYTISPDSLFVAKTLQELGIKEKYGVTIVMIERGQKRILAPTRTEILLPYDKVFLVGPEEKLIPIKDLIETNLVPNLPPLNLPPLDESFGLTSIGLLPTDPFINKSISESGLQETVNGVIVGLERNGKRILGPDSATVLQAGDQVWIVGDRFSISAIR